MVAAVEAQGFGCEYQTIAWVCRTGVGTTGFELALNPHDDEEGLIKDVSASVHAGPDTDVPGAALPFFSWAASLPFGDDPAAAEVTAWIEQQIESGSNTRARIASYDYEVEHTELPSRNRVIELTILPRP